MNIKVYSRGLSKYTKALNNLSEESGISKCYLYIDCLWSYLRYGCVLNHYTEGQFFKRRTFERKRIFTYRKWLKVLTYNECAYNHLLKNKIDFNNYFQEYIGRKWIYSNNIDYDVFMSFLKLHNSVFIKPIDGLEGDGCQIVKYEEGTDYSTLFDKLKSGCYLIEEVVKQHPDMIFGNKSVNTIRVYTIYDKKAGKAVCFKTTLRAGIGDSIVDNSHSGGISYEIDIPTGIIDSRGWGHVGSGGIIHPGTTICMLGRKIPFWNDVTSMCENAAAKIPQVRYIGWDVAITSKGPLLIEGNNTPDIDIMEFVGNYGYYNIIKSHLK